MGGYNTGVACDVPLEKLRFFMFMGLSKMKLALHFKTQILWCAPKGAPPKHLSQGCANAYFGRDGGCTGAIFVLWAKKEIVNRN